MNPERLLQHFERISEAPDAIPRLRRFILDLAVRGKLVEQDPNDESAAELLKRIQAEKARLVKEGKIKQEKPLQSRANDSMPTELPKGWLWGCIQEVFTSVTDGDHIPPPKSESGIPFLVIGDVRSQLIDFGNCRYVPDTYYQQLDEIRRPTKGDVLYTLVGSYGIPVVVRDDRPFCVQRHIGILRPSQYVNVDCLARILESRVVFDQATRCATGIAQKTVPLAGLRGILIPLPPLAEQHRIVAKVDELMALCDQLEAANTEREQSRDRLVMASLHRLNSPADRTETDAPDLPVQQADAFRNHARFVFKHLPRLTARPEHIKQLRQTILNLAVCGKLVPQNPSDEPVSSQLALNDYARKEIAQKDRRADSSLQQLLVPEEKWAVPVSWEWRGVADLVLFIDYRGKTPSKEEAGIRLITAKNVRKGFISLSPEEFLAESDYRAWMTRGIPQEGDVLFTTEAPMGNAAVVRLKERFALAQRVINFRPYGALDPDFLVLQLLAEPFQSILDKTATGLTAKGIKAAKLKRLPMAIPPLAEQHRIVARVDELMALCDQLEAELTTTKADSRRLLEAVLHEALAPALEETV